MATIYIMRIGIQFGRSIQKRESPASGAVLLPSDMTMKPSSAVGGDDGGLRKAQIDAASAEQRQAIAACGDAALNAFGEVESALDQGIVVAARSRELEEASIEADKALRIANLRYKEGESDLLDVLTIQQRVIATRSNLLSIQRQHLEQRVNLHLAIGGNW